MHKTLEGHCVGAKTGVHSSHSRNRSGTELKGRLEIYNVSYWTRTFFTFLGNRIATIRRVSDLKQWRYVQSELNPADYASWGINAL